MATKPANIIAAPPLKSFASKLADAALEGKQLRENKAVKSTAKVQTIKAEDAGVVEETAEV